MKTLKHHELLNIEMKVPGTISDLFSDVTTFSSFCTKIKNKSKEFQKFSYKDKEKFLGDLFEIFAEIFFILNENDNRIGIYNYKPITGNDYGVDGLAKDILCNKQSAVQVKFRSNPTVELISDDLKQFVGHAFSTYDIDKNLKTSLIVFTNTKGLHWHTAANVFNNKVSVVDNNLIKMIIDDNTAFWNNSKELIKETINAKFL